MIVQIGDYEVKAEKCVSIKFKDKDKGLLMIVGEQSKYIYINPDEISYVHIEK